VSYLLEKGLLVYGYFKYQILCLFVAMVNENI